jgi:hypothetical protein
MALIALLVFICVASVLRWMWEYYHNVEVYDRNPSGPFFTKWGPLIAMVVVSLGFLIIGSV